MSKTNSTIQFLRGEKEDVESQTGLPFGYPIYSTNTKELYIADGDGKPQKVTNLDIIELTDYNSNNAINTLMNNGKLDLLLISTSEHTSINNPACINVLGTEKIKDIINLPDDLNSSDINHLCLFRKVYEIPGGSGPLSSRFTIVELIEALPVNGRVWYNTYNPIIYDSSSGTTGAWSGWYSINNELKDVRASTIGNASILKNNAGTNFDLLDISEDSTMTISTTNATQELSRYPSEIKDGFQAMREVIRLNNSQNTIMVRLTEAYPTYGRVWYNKSNSNGQTWSGWSSSKNVDFANFANFAYYLNWGNNYKTNKIIEPNKRISFKLPYSYGAANNPLEGVNLLILRKPNNRYFTLGVFAFGPETKDWQSSSLVPYYEKKENENALEGQLRITANYNANDGDANDVELIIENANSNSFFNSKDLEEGKYYELLITKVASLM